MERAGCSSAGCVAQPSEVTGHPAPSPVSLTVVAMMLAFVAGFVDAVGYLHVVNVFPANQSGNVAFLGLSIGGASPAPGWGPPVAIAAFMVGVAVARWSSLRVGPRRRGDPPRTGANPVDGSSRHLRGGGRA